VPWPDLLIAAGSGCVVTSMTGGTGMVGGNPAVLNDCGNDLMSEATSVAEAVTTALGNSTFQTGSLGDAASGTAIGAAYADVVAALDAAASNLGGTLAEDGYLLQRASRELDTVMNDADGTGSGSAGGG